MGRGKNRKLKHNRKAKQKEPPHAQEKVQPLPEAGQLSEPSGGAPNRQVDTKDLRNAILAACAWILSLIGVQDLYPFWSSLTFYVIAFGMIVWAEWHWELIATRRARWKIVVGALTFVAFVALLWSPVTRQYSKEYSMTITFKDSKYFPWWRKQLIVHDLRETRDYLLGLGIPVPAVVPPITIYERPGVASGVNMPPGNIPVARGGLLIGPEENRKVATGSYIDYVMLYNESKIEQTFPAQTDVMNKLLIESLGRGFSEYFNGSFWNDPEPHPFVPGGVLWDLRNALGKSFADELAAAAFQTWAQDPSDVIAPDFNNEAIRALMLGDSAVESECEKWPRIRDVIIKRGIPKDQITGQQFKESFALEVCSEKWKQ